MQSTMSEATVLEGVQDKLPFSAQFDADPADFNAVGWVNNVLSSESSPDTSHLLDMLNDDIRDSHATLDSSLKTALSAVPWVVRETEKVRQRANLLRAGVDGVGQRVEGVESGVASSVMTIADADTIVRRVQHASDLLGQAVEAERLLGRLDALLASFAADGSDLVSAADVVSKLRATLIPLKPISELADRFAQLDAADRKLEALAAPQLQKALEGRNTQAAINARIVFDHAGRDNAFQAQYVSLRGNQVAKLWSGAWEAKEAAITEEEKASLAGASGDLAGMGAESTLVSFYGSLYDMLRAESEWLQETFPDLREALLPALICEAVGNLKNPLPVANVFVPVSAPDSESAVDGTLERLAGVARASVTASARIAILLLPNSFAEAAEDDSMIARAEQVSDAITTVLGPFRAFWSSMTQIAIRKARTSARAVHMSSLSGRGSSGLPSTDEGRVQGATAQRSAQKPALVDLAKDVESITTEALASLDSMLSSLNQSSSGAGIYAMKQASMTLSSVLSDRILGILRMPSSKIGRTEDEWAQVSGALRLLCAASALKRSWDSRKESLFAVSVGTATPALEVASLVRENPVKRIQQFMKHVEDRNLQEAGVVWELNRDNELPKRIVAEFESLDDSQDFQNVLDSVHRVVYDTMFGGVKQRFSSFNIRNISGSESVESDTSILGFSSSPLGYATEVADYLMTIPQQLEPFIPEEEDVKYATPRSPYIYSKSGHSTKTSVTAEQDDTLAEDPEDESNTVSFAGMWISLLAVGTMELYVEKICGLSKLSEGATRQLATDADYICNVIASLGVPPTSEMALAKRLLECPNDAASFKEGMSGCDTAEQRKISRKIAAIRGINVAI